MLRCSNAHSINDRPSFTCKYFLWQTSGPGGDLDTSRDADADVSSCEDSEAEGEEGHLLRIIERQKTAHNADELVVTAAKQMGKELYAHLNRKQRRQKLDAMVSKIWLRLFFSFLKFFGA